MQTRQVSRRTWPKQLSLAGASPAATLAALFGVGWQAAHEQKEPVAALGPGTSLHGRRVFRPDNPWNTKISHLPVDPRSQELIASIGLDHPLNPDFGTTYRGAPSGIP